MSMGRYLCQLCWSIVHYGERHPCFLYKDDEEVYTVPPPNEPEETKGKDERKSKETRTGNTTGNSSNICAATQRKGSGEPEETRSLPVGNNGQISTTSASKRRRSYSALFSPTFLRGMKNSTSDSKSASRTYTGREGNRAKARKSKVPRKMTSASPEVPHIDDSSNSEIPTNSSVADAEAVSVPGPSGVQSQPRRKGKEGRFVCDVCGKDFVHQGDLNAHMRTHTGDRPFVCSTCGKGFTKQSNLTRHFRTHTGERPFKCHICSKAFSQKAHLVDHLRTHSGEKPFKCKFCGKEFAYQSNCIRHERRKHGGM